MEGTNPVNKKLVAALSGGAALVLALTGCSDDSNKKLNDWAKTFCDPAQAQFKQIQDANGAMQTADDGSTDSKKVQQTDSAAFQKISSAYSSLAKSLERPGRRRPNRASRPSRTPSRSSTHCPRATRTSRSRSTNSTPRTSSSSRTVAISPAASTNSTSRARQPSRTWRPATSARRWPPRRAARTRPRPAPRLPRSPRSRNGRSVRTRGESPRRTRTATAPYGPATRPRRVWRRAVADCRWQGRQWWV